MVAHNIKRIIQFSAGFNLGDAISNEMQILNIYFQKAGFVVELYSENVGKNAKGLVNKYKSYRSKKGDFLIYHHSIHSAVFDYILNLQNPKALIYHNVTPSHFFEPYDLKLAYYLKKGREELKELNGKFLLYYADSEFNKKELTELGISEVCVLPIVYDFSKLKRKVMSKKNEIKKIIFVGRIAPNKKQDDIIKLAKVLKDYFFSDFEIHLVGNCSHELKLYKDELHSLIHIFRLENHVFFSNFIDDNSLWDYYQNADLFICMSEHEGFCVPLLESMFYKVPILAYDAGAVKNTLDGAGVLFKEKNFSTICECIVKIFSDMDFRDKILKSQKDRLSIFQKRNQQELIIQAIKDLNL